MRGQLTAIFLAALVLAALPARAQEAAEAERAKPAFNEVEHGGYAGGEVGFLMLRGPGGGKGVATGSVIGVSLGYDFAPWIGLGFFGLAFDAVAPAGYAGLGKEGDQGDFTGLLPGVELRFHLPIASDSNLVDRLFLNLGVGGGVLFYQPRGLFPSGHSAAGKADVGIEYFTHLRHFSLGLVLEGLGALPRGGQLGGGSLSPFLRYTF